MGLRVVRVKQDKDALTRQDKRVNLLGDLWEGGAPDVTKALAVPGVRVHLYGKKDSRPGRKMGHLSADGATAEEALDRVCKAYEALLRK